MKHLLFIGFLSSVSALTIAGNPEFEFDRLVTKPWTDAVYSPRVIAGTSDANGGVYFASDYGGHNVYYLANPRGDQNAPNYSKEIYSDDTLSPDFGSIVGQGAWLGLTIDPNGTVFATGHGPNGSAALKITRDGSAFSASQLTLPPEYKGNAISIRLGGCTAVAPNRFVAPNYRDGSLHFFHVSDSTAFLEDIVSAPTEFVGYAPTTYYVDNKIYMTHSSHATVGNANGGLWVWASDGTADGTHTPTQLVAPIHDYARARSLYSSIGYSQKHKAIAINEGHNGYGEQGWRIYDATQTDLPWQSYLFLNGSETGAPGILPPLETALGSIFFKDGEDEFLMGSTENAPRQILIYRVVPNTSVEDWSVY